MLDHGRRNKHPRVLTDPEKEKVAEFQEKIHYSSRYSDDQFEYRHVQLPKEMIKKIPKDYIDSTKGTLKLLWEEEWRSLGITQVFTPEEVRLEKSESAHRILQSLGWEHYEVHEPEPHILLFKRPINFQAQEQVVQY